MELTLNGTVTPDAATYKNIVWSVEETGAGISAIGEGNTITATTAGTVRARGLPKQYDAERASRSRKRETEEKKGTERETRYLSIVYGGIAKGGSQLMEAAAL